MNRAERDAVAAAVEVLEAAGATWTLKHGRKHRQIEVLGRWKIALASSPSSASAAVNTARQHAQRIVRQARAARILPPVDSV